MKWNILFIFDNLPIIAATLCRPSEKVIKLTNGF